MDSSYLVPVAQLMRNVPSTTHLEFSARFDADHEFAPRGRAETDVNSDATVDVTVTLQSFSGGLRAKGRVSAPWFGVCRRCSVTVVGIADVAVNERFVDSPEPGDEEAYLIENDFIDLAPMVHDAILLELPLAPLCREDCQGLCPYCGIDRNEATCGCSAPVDPRWATLDGLRFADETSGESNEA
jgi:uncharacterized protein